MPSNFLPSFLPNSVIGQCGAGGQGQWLLCNAVIVGGTLGRTDSLPTI